MCRPRRCRREVDDLLPPPVGLAVELEPVRADVHDAVDADARPDVVAGAAAHDGNERVTLTEAAQLVARLLGRVRILRPRDDRCEHAVEVEKERSLLRRRRQMLEQRARDGHARSISRCVSC